MRRAPDAATATCRAKLNLVLEILGTRADGYHDIATVMHPIDLADTLTVRRAKPGIALITKGLRVPAGDENIVVRAVREFHGRVGGEPRIEATLEKRIPTESGLGGGSADAAGTLACLATLHGIASSDPRLLSAAAQLGADVPFFLSGGAALAEGLGDRLSRLPATRFWVVLAATELGVSTKWAYEQVEPQHYTHGVRARRAALTLVRRGEVRELWNAFMPALAAGRPDLQELAGLVSDLVGSAACLTGSGSCVYAMAPNGRLAGVARDALVARGYWAWCGRSAAVPLAVRAERGTATAGGPIQ